MKWDLWGEIKKTLGDKPRNQFKEIAMELYSMENKALDIIKNLPTFNWQSFERYFLSNRAANNSINEAYNICIKELRLAGNLGTAESYECAQRSLFKFSINAKFGDVTPEFLKGYWLEHLTHNQGVPGSNPGGPTIQERVSANLVAGN